jgi:hypothetical protein
LGPLLVGSERCLAKHHSQVNKKFKKNARGLKSGPAPSHFRHDILQVHPYFAPLLRRVMVVAAQVVISPSPLKIFSTKRWWINWQ